MLKRTRRNGSSSMPLASSEVQQLESKQLLTGTVTLAISASNDVSVTGDDQANDIDVTINAGKLSVVGNGGTLIKFGNNAPVAAINNVTIPGIRDLNVNLKGGDDSITVTVGSPLTAIRNVNLNSGSGSDSVAVLANATLTINGRLTVNTGSGDDFVGLASDRGSVVTVKGDVSVDTGSGADAVGITDLQKQNGARTAAALQAIRNDSKTPNAQRIRFDRDLKIKTGNDDDVVGILGVQVGRDAEINSGFGHGDVLGVSNMRVGRNLDLIYGDANALTDVAVGGKLKVRSGTGDDTFFVTDISASEIDVDLGSGKDQISADRVTATKATIKGGSGKDNIRSSAKAKYKSFEGNDVDPTIVDDVVASLVNAGIL